jgi:hypothetical protein
MCYFDEIMPKHYLKCGKKCKICCELFNMKDSLYACCLNECNEHEICRGCQNGVNSKKFNKFKRNN